MTMCKLTLPLPVRMPFHPLPFVAVRCPTVVALSRPLLAVASPILPQVSISRFSFLCPPLRIPVIRDLFPFLPPSRKRYIHLFPSWFRPTASEDWLEGSGCTLHREDDLFLCDLTTD